MIAGRLNEIINILRAEEIVNEYGETVETFKVFFKTRARVDHRGGNRTAENDEIVFEYGKTFIFRSYVPVKDTDRIEYQGKMYRILTTEHRREHNDIVIEAELINE